MLNVPGVLSLRLGSLKSTVGDWEEMVRKLQSLATGESEGVNATKLHTATRDAEWRGESATVNREFVLKTASEFKDAVKAARSVHAVLRDAHSAFVRHKDELDTALADATKRGIYINDKGGAVPPSAPPGVAGKDAKEDWPSDAEVANAERTVMRILHDVDDTDRIAARALRALARNKHDFTSKEVKGLKGADSNQGAADAEYWAKKIAKGSVEDWSEEELKRFNETVALQHDNPAFAARFAGELGGEETLRFWRDLAAPPGAEIEGDRAKLLANVQDNLSMTLAQATSTNAHGMDDWKQEVINAGSKQFPLNGVPQGGPYGFQIMSGLMEKGKFDSKFLDGYGEKLLEFERGHRDSVLGTPGNLWSDTTQLNYPPSDTPNDPIAGFMESLGHNPKASLEFFNGGTGEGASDGIDRLSNWDYLVGQGEDARKWPDGENGKPAGFDKLGHALESATLGYAYDEKYPEIPPTNTEAEIKARDARTLLMSNVVDAYNSADAIDGQPGIRDSLSNMAAGHINSINYTMADFGETGKLADRDGLFGNDKQHLRDFGMSDTSNFLRALSSEEDSYSKVSAAQQVYGASLMAAQGDNHQDAIDAGLYSATTHGMLDEARTEAIGKEFADDKTARNKELEKQAAWRNFAASAAIGTTAGVAAGVFVPVGAAAVIAVPLAFDAIGGAAGTHFSNNTIDWLEAREYDNTDDAIKGIQMAQRDGERNAMAPLLNYAEGQGMTPQEVRDMTRDAQSSYIAGGRFTDTDDVRGF